MQHFPGERIFSGQLSRRDILWLIAAASAPAITGCATDPVTGHTTLVGLSEQDELRLDRAQAPAQFSADYGAVQDPALNDYVNNVEQRIGSVSHRPQMPYSARVVNASYINAYSFPGGSLALTRGILLEMESEDELAALLGHETGHVNGRHAAEQAGRQQVAGAALGAVSVAAGLYDVTGLLQPVIGAVGQVGGSALLASYSRDDEREADTLGFEYADFAGYSSQGMVDLMDMLSKEGKGQPSLIETMFATHPLSAERYQTALSEADSRFAASRARPLQKERFMDMTARLRQQKPAVDELQKADAAFAGRNFAAAREHLGGALALLPDDYAGNVMMAKVYLAQKQAAEAEPYLEKATAVYPQEAQAQYLAGIADLSLQQPEQALQRFQTYDRLLPGNPQTLFFRGVAYESMQNKKLAAENYYRFLQTGARNQQAQYAAKRLQQWGVIR